MLEKLRIQGKIYYTGHRIVQVDGYYVMKRSENGHQYQDRVDACAMVKRIVLEPAGMEIHEIMFDSETDYMAWKKALEPKKENQ